MKSERFNPIKKLLLFLVFFSFGPLVVGQVLTVYPAFPSADTEITLVFDVRKASDGRAAALLNRSDDVYLWAWGGGNPANRTNPEYTLDGQTAFNQPFAPAKLTPLGNDRWSIRLTPRQFLKLSADKTLRWMGALVKSGNGSAQTEDTAFELYLPTVQVAFFSPNRSNLAPEAGSSLAVTVQASARATLSLTLDNQPIASATDTVLTANVPVGPASSTPRTLRITAQANGQTARDSLTFSVLPAPTVEALPTGLKDGITYAPDGKSATLVLMAPGKKSVYVLGEFNNWELKGDFLMKKTPDGQRFWLPVSGLTPGQEVAFQYLVDGQIPTGDPYAEKLLDRQHDASIPASTYPNLKPFPTAARGNVVSVLQPGKPAFAWQTAAFQRPASDNLV
ncbi:MAG: alpha-amylase, partial [Sphingobacteriaceae bacterium]|nr:alpha-amylase [Cytophagaceae bacterium]